MSLETEFSEFWSEYPRRVGKLAAYREYVKARKVASAAAILAGVQRYRQHLPQDEQYICHPRTFLYQGRWEDEYEVAVERAAPGSWCPHDTKCHSPVWCETLRWKAKQEAV